MKPLPLYAAVGNPCLDLVEGQRVPGGSSVYAAVLASRYGFSARVVGAVGPDAFAEIAQVLERNGVDASVLVRAEGTTVFENRYDEAGNREQRMVSAGSPVSPTAEDLAGVSVLHLAPIANELALTEGLLLPRTPGRFVGLTAQGLLRRRAPDGSVTLAEVRVEARLAHAIDAVVVSDTEAGFCEALLDDVVAGGGVSVVTHGSAGAEARTRKGTLHVPARAAAARDVTGAGDVFAAVLFAELWRGTDLPAAGSRASAAAALCVGTVGVEALPTYDEVVAAAS